MRTVQLALEILTGACATLPDPEYGAPPGDEGGEGENDDIDEGFSLPYIVSSGHYFPDTTLHV